MSAQPIQTGATAVLSGRYDRAAPAWGDKMRSLGYCDAYLGFLADATLRDSPLAHVLDVGAGTAAFAEAWAAINGRKGAITLLDPSAKMIVRGAERLTARGVEAAMKIGTLETLPAGERYDVLLAAHVLEHGEAEDMLARMRAAARHGARLWLVVSKPHWCNAIIWLQWRHRSYAPDEVRRMLARTGWQLEDEYAFPSGPPSRTSRGYRATTA